jgi:transglutaminase-like putative cysteine protease
MKVPPGLTGAALLLWGWEAGLPWLGVLMAAIMEAPHVLKARWQFSQADLDRVWNLCVALFLGATIYAFVSRDNFNAVSQLLRESSSTNRLGTLNQSKRSLFQLLQWLPLMFLPVALAQAFGQQEQMHMSTFSWWLRRKRGQLGDHTGYFPMWINVGYPYFACCLFGASAGNERSLWFAAAFVGLIAWALWSQHTGTYTRVGWIVSFIMTLALGAALQLGMLQLQRLAQRLDETLLAQWASTHNLDAGETQTRIGALGRLKLSGRIILRVDSHGQAPPPLLRQSSYDAFQAPYWRCSQLESFKPVNSEASPSWVLHAARGPTHTATISGYLHRARAVLPLPHGTARLDQLPAVDLETNLFGTVRVENAPGFAEFETDYQFGRSIDSSPSHFDSELFEPERSAVEEIAGRLDLKRLRQISPQRAIQAVERFFAENFTYSLVQNEQHVAKWDRTALARFLLENHSGHCEYFASATVLLLRAAGIPARYAVGYAVQEKQGQTYIVRERHAHAWCLAYVDGIWRDIDTTPAGWSALEASRVSWWEPIRDLFSAFWFEFSRWRWGHAEWKHYALWLIIPLLAFALGKLLLQKQWRRAPQAQPGLLETANWPGRDSEFYEVERHIAQAGLPRHPGETDSAWLERVVRTGALPSNGLKALLAWHYRLRFDPVGLTEPERAELRASAQKWLRSTTGPAM